MKNVIRAADRSNDMLDYLLKRRSCPAKILSGPGPSKDEIKTILTAAARVPDHGKLFPWYFIVFDGDTRKQVGAHLAESWKTEEPEASPAKLELESERFLRAPLVIAVISRVRPGKHPAWEQILSAGAACQDMCLAANAMGYGTHWLSEWYAYNDTFRNILGLDEHDNIAGFIYIGTPTETPDERDRPDLDKIVTYWEPNCTPNKGDDVYGHPDLGYPKACFKV